MSPSNTETPFTLSIPDVELDLLRRKLACSRFPDELDGAGWGYGVPLADLKRLVAHWKDGFDWRKAEADINRLPMFTRDIEIEGFGSLNIHYIHQRSNVANAIPLLFVHGCESLSLDLSSVINTSIGPGHFLEVEKLLPLLTAGSPDHPSFHVVAPSLPGYGFSEAPRQPGFKGPQYAEVWAVVHGVIGQAKVNRHAGPQQIDAISRLQRIWCAFTSRG